MVPPADVLTKGNTERGITRALWFGGQTDVCPLVLATLLIQLICVQLLP